MVYVLIMLGFLVTPGKVGTEPLMSSAVFPSAESCQIGLLSAMHSAQEFIVKGVDPVAVCVPVKPATSL